jgi:hypothetical protein
MNFEPERQSALVDELEKIAKVKKDNGAYDKNRRLTAFGVGAAPFLGAQVGFGIAAYHKIKAATERNSKRFGKNTRKLRFGSDGKITVSIKPKSGENSLTKKLKQIMGTKAKVYLDTSTAIRSGFGGYSPTITKATPHGAVHLPAEKITARETGVLSHELGHAKNFEALDKLKITKPYMALRAATGPAALLTSAFTVGAKDDKNAKKSAIIGSAIAAPMLAEETIATARGLGGLSKLHGGMWKGLTQGRGAATAAMNIGSYAALAGMPAFAYMARKHFKKGRKYEK